MQIELKLETAIKKIIITDEHPSSINGMPVAVVDGVAYGPNDLLPIWAEDELSWLQGIAATDVAAAAIEMNRQGRISEDQLGFIRKFYS